MTGRRRNVLYTLFLAFLFVYARSEGGRFPTFLFVVFAIIFGTELLAFFIFRRAVKVDLVVPEEAAEAETPYDVGVKLRFPRVAPGTLQIRYSLPYGWSSSEHGELQINLPWGETSASTTLQLRPERRGAYQLGPFFAVFEDPLRLFSGRVRILPSQQVLVGPARIPIWQLEWLSNELDSGRHLDNNSELTSSARAYQHGDPWKRIHWKASARRQKLMVRESEEPENHALLLWLDLAYGSYVNDVDKLEIAISLAYTLLVYLAEQGIPVRFVASRHHPREFNLPGDDLDEIRHYLALARADGEVKPAEAFEALRPDGTVWIITGKLSTQLADHIGYHARRFEHTLIILAGVSEKAISNDLNVNSHVEIRCYHGAKG